MNVCSRVYENVHVDFYFNNYRNILEQKKKQFFIKELQFIISCFYLHLSKFSFHLMQIFKIIYKTQFIGYLLT